MNLSNQLTLLRIILVPVFYAVAIVALPQWNYVAAVVFLVASLTDTLDGRIARKRNQVTDFGKLVDPIADKMLTSAAMVVLIYWGKLSPVFGIILIGRDCIVNPLRHIAAKEGVAISAKWSGKAKTLLQVIGYLAYLVNQDDLANFAICLATVLTLYSVYEYCWPNRAIIQKVGWGRFLFLFIDKIAIYWVLFVLCYEQNISIFIAACIIGKDTILSGISTMAALYGEPLETRGLDMVCVVVMITGFVAICFTNTVGQYLLYATAALCFVSLMDYALRYSAILKKIFHN